MLFLLLLLHRSLSKSDKIRKSVDCKKVERKEDITINILLQEAQNMFDRSLMISALAAGDEDFLTLSEREVFNEIASNTWERSPGSHPRLMAQPGLLPKYQG